MIKLKKNITFYNNNILKNIIQREGNIPHRPYLWF